MSAPLALVLLLSACSEDESAESADPAETTTSIEDSGTDDDLPAELAGEFLVDGSDRFQLLAAGDAFCADEVATEGACYSVTGEDGVLIEYGTLVAEGDTLTMVPAKDPNPDCVGASNTVQWEATEAGVTLTPIEDCHGTTPLELTRS